MAISFPLIRRRHLHRAFISLFSGMLSFALLMPVQAQERHERQEASINNEEHTPSAASMLPTRTTALPSLPTSGLPPIPATGLPPSTSDTVLPPPVSLPHRPAQQMPPIPGGATPSPVQPVFAALPEEYNEDMMRTGLSSEIQRLEQALSPLLLIRLIEPDELLFQHLNEQGYYQHQIERAVQGIYVALPQHPSTPRQPTCFIVVRPELAPTIWRDYIYAFSQMSHRQTGFAYVVAREVGRCLDRQTQHQSLNRRLAWTSQQTYSIGLHTRAVEETYGSRFNKSVITGAPAAEIYEHPVQQQFEQRVCDAFALTWLLKLGARDDIVPVLISRQGDDTTSPLHTTPALQHVMSQQRAQIQRTQRADLLWEIARQTQQSVGVSDNISSLHAGPTDQQPRVARWIVTSRGVIPVDAQGREIPSQSPAGTQRRRTFDQQRRFNQR